MHFPPRTQLHSGGPYTPTGAAAGSTDGKTLAETASAGAGAVAVVAGGFMTGDVAATASCVRPLFLAEGFFAVFLAVPFFAAATFLLAAFLTVFFLPPAVFFAARLAAGFADFLPTAFLALAFLVAAFLTDFLAAFTAIALEAAFLPAAFLADVFFLPVAFLPAVFLLETRLAVCFLAMKGTLLEVTKEMGEMRLEIYCNHDTATSIWASCIEVSRWLPVAALRWAIARRLLFNRRSHRAPLAGFYCQFAREVFLSAVPK